MKRNPIKIKTKLKIEDQLLIGVLTDLTKFLEKSIIDNINKLKASNAVKSAYYGQLHDDLYSIKTKIKNQIEKTMDSVERRRF